MALQDCYRPVFNWLVGFGRLDGRFIGHLISNDFPSLAPLAAEQVEARTGHRSLDQIEKDLGLFAVLPAIGLNHRWDGTVKPRRAGTHADPQILMDLAGPRAGAQVARLPPDDRAPRLKAPRPNDLERLLKMALRHPQEQRCVLRRYLADGQRFNLIVRHRVVARVYATTDARTEMKLPRRINHESGEPLVILDARIERWRGVGSMADIKSMQNFLRFDFGLTGRPAAPFSLVEHGMSHGVVVQTHDR
jgi:hypothetical protein